MRQRTAWSHHTLLDSEPISPSRARDFVTQALVEHDLLYLVEDVRLVASELATNAVRHARTSFTVTLERREDAVVLLVDDGSPVTPTLLDPELLDAGGRGLSIIDVLSHEWGVVVTDDGTKSVWASFATRPHVV